jgi:hypothetical protein
MRTYNTNRQRTAPQPILCSVVHIMCDQVTGDWPPIPYTDRGDGGAYLKSLGLKGPSDSSPGESLSFPLLDREEYSKDYLQSR